MDVPSGAVFSLGLSMPHSPYWHAGRFWLCESGAGTIGFIDPNSLRHQPIVELPGFTRGLDLVGNLVFLGLSQVRESAVFNGIPITERLAEEKRTGGVAVLDLTTGTPVARLWFEDTVQEVFVVQVLHGKCDRDQINDTSMENPFVLPDEALREAPAAPSVRRPRIRRKPE
jgi:uncharacterized protein (TIGR03032 family)